MMCREGVSPQPLPLACDDVSLTDKTDEVAAADAALVRGNVPPAAEWGDAWALLSETSALRKCARVRRTQFSTADPTEERTRKRRRNQLCVMAEVLRAETRGVLRHATPTSLSLDEANYRKVARYRADKPALAAASLGTLGLQATATLACSASSIARRATQPSSRRTTPRRP